MNNPTPKAMSLIDKLFIGKILNGWLIVLSHDGSCVF